MRLHPRWAALLADEPIWLRIDTGKWPPILAALPSARLRLCALEFYTHPQHIGHDSKMEVSLLSVHCFVYSTT